MWVPSVYPSENIIGFLQSPYIANDLFDLVIFNSVNWRHVAESPVVLPHAIFGRQVKSLIGVVIWLINAMHKWWADSIASSCIPSMT
jgi:hypothetical protein